MSEDSNTVAAKTFHLRPQETEKIALLRQHLDAIYSIEISTIAADRLGYQVTPQTQFRIAPDFTSLQIWEKPTAINEQAPSAPGGDGIIPA